MAWILISRELRCSGREASHHGTGLALPLEQLGWDWGSIPGALQRSLIPPGVGVAYLLRPAPGWLTSWLQPWARVGRGGIGG